jgi:hypothetical protein
MQTASRCELFDVQCAAERLGGISPWTLRKHIARGTVTATRIGRRVLISAIEIRRIQRHGLPSLTKATVTSVDRSVS